MRSEIAGIWGVVALMVLAAVPSAAEPVDGVLADLPFLAQGGGYDVDASHIVVDLGVPGGRPMPLLLDTGANWSFMTPRAAKQLGVSVRRHKSKPYRRATSLGRDLQFWVDVRSSDTGSRSRWEIGVLGGNFLEKYTVEIDYVTPRVRFLDPDVHPVSREPTRAGEIVAPLRMDGRRPYLDLAIGAGRASFLVDTGAYFDLEISEPRASKLEIASGDGEIVQGRNWVGRDSSRLSHLESVRIGDAESGPSELRTTVRAESDWRHTNQAGSDEAVLGSEFLSRFHVRIDYEHRPMSLVRLTPEEREAVLAARSGSRDVDGVGAPAPEATETRVQTVRLAGAGMTAPEIEPGVFEVRAMDSDGPAAEFGLRPSDVVLHPSGSERLAISEVETRIIEGEELTVARRDGDIWVDVVLPEPVYFEE